VPAVDGSAPGRAVAAAKAADSACGLRVDDWVVLSNSNRLAVHLQPCDVLARVAPLTRQNVATPEVDVARRLAEVGAPVAKLEPRVEPRVYEQDGFAVTLWAYYRPVPPQELESEEYAAALQRLHAGMRDADPTGSWPRHFLDRVDEAQRIVDDLANRPAIAGADREVLGAALRTMRRAITERGAPEQLVHGEPHPGNVLRTERGLLFVDLETCCRGPVEFDIAHATIHPGGPPVEVGVLYAGADESLVRECSILVLAMVAAWRCEPGDDFPNGPSQLKDCIRQLRADIAL